MLKIVKLSFKASEKCLVHVCFIKPDKDSSRKEHSRPCSSSWTQAQKSSTNMRKSNPAMVYRKNSTSQSLWFVPGTKGWFSFPKSGDRIHHANSLKGKKHLIMSVQKKKKKKTFEKIQHSFMINVAKQTWKRASARNLQLTYLVVREYFPLKMGSKAVKSVLTTAIPHPTGSASQCRKSK